MAEDCIHLIWPVVPSPITIYSYVALIRKSRSLYSHSFYLFACHGKISHISLWYSLQSSFNLSGLGNLKTLTLENGLHKTKPRSSHDGSSICFLLL